MDGKSNWKWKQRAVLFICRKVGVFFSFKFEGRGFFYPCMYRSKHIWERQNGRIFVNHLHIDMEESGIVVVFCFSFFSGIFVLFTLQDIYVQKTFQEKHWTKHRRTSPSVSFQHPNFKTPKKKHSGELKWVKKWYPLVIHSYSNVILYFLLKIKLFLLTFTIQ